MTLGQVYAPAAGANVETRKARPQQTSTGMALIIVALIIPAKKKKK